MQITPNGTGGATFTAQQIGTFQVPGTASATSGRKTNAGHVEVDREVEGRLGRRGAVAVATSLGRASRSRLSGREQRASHPRPVWASANLVAASTNAAASDGMSGRSDSTSSFAPSRSGSPSDSPTRAVRPTGPSSSIGRCGRPVEVRERVDSLLALGWVSAFALCRAGSRSRSAGLRW